MKPLNNFKRQIIQIFLNDHVHKRGKETKPGLSIKRQTKIKAFANELADELNCISDRNVQEAALNSLIKSKDILQDIVNRFHEFVNPKAKEIAPGIDRLQGYINWILNFIDHTVEKTLQIEIFLDEIDVNIVEKEIQALRSKETYFDDFEINMLLSRIKTTIHYHVERFKNSWLYDELDANVKDEFNSICHDYKNLIDHFKKYQFDLSRDIDFLNLLTTVKNNAELAVNDENTICAYDIAAFRINSLLTELDFKIKMIEYVINSVELKNTQSPCSNEDLSKTETKNDKEDEEVETTKEKVTRLLLPLKEKSKKGRVILGNSEFDSLVDAYVDYIDDNNKLPTITWILPGGTNSEFYSVLKNMHDKIELEVSGVGEMLNRLLQAKKNNTKDKRKDRVKPDVIETKINSYKGYLDSKKPVPK